ncbi:MAG: HipA domain-containing protein [Pseudomonadota bacterium]|nr:HipA domain-containing protein [Pseudomonadota bacterium]
MSDRHAVIWTRSADAPLKLGNLVVTQRESRFSYSDEALARDDVPGVSLLCPKSATPPVFQAKGGFFMYPRLMALIPPPGHNLQRQIYTRLLQAAPGGIPAGQDLEWALFLLAGRNGIGHLDVFPDDLAADRWYRLPAPAPSQAIGPRSRLWTQLREGFVHDLAPLDARMVEHLIGPTPSAGGMTTKLLAAIPDAPRWAGRIAPPGTQRIGDTTFTDVVLKIEQPHYAGLAELEALCLRVHRECGFDTPRFWRSSQAEMEFLAVERFDRSGGLPLPLESFYALLAMGRRDFLSTADITLDELGQTIPKLAAVASLEVKSTQEAIFRRVVLALLTGNGDLHLENLSLLGGAREARLAPVYDPAPMRAWARHDLRFAIPIDFDNAHGGVAGNLIAWAPAFGMKPARAREIIATLLEQTRDYPERVMALEKVPPERRQRLVAVVRRERQGLVKELGTEQP